GARRPPPGRRPRTRVAPVTKYAMAGPYCEVTVWTAGWTITPHQRPGSPGVMRVVRLTACQDLASGGRPGGAGSGVVAGAEHDLVPARDRGAAAGLLDRLAGGGLVAAG